jgi:hypothetical protein
MKTILLMIGMVIFSANSLLAENNNEQLTKKNEEKTESYQNQRLYFWEVKTLYGNAKGVSHSENEAKRMIALFSESDYLVFKIITSSPKN